MRESSFGKKLLIGIVIIGLILGGFIAINILQRKGILDLGGGLYITQTREPINVHFENNILTWRMVDGAKEYVIKVDNKTYKTTENFYDFSDLEVGKYDIKIKAISEKMRDSNYVELNDCLVMSKEQFDQIIYEDIVEAISDTNKYFENVTPIFFERKDDKLIVFVLCYKKYHTDIDIFSEYSFHIPEDSKVIREYINADNIELNFEITIDKGNHSIKNVDFSKIELVGNIKKLSIDGWEIEKLVEELVANEYDFDKECLWGTYLLISKCQKDDEVKYVYQICKIPYYTDSPSMYKFAEMFEAGDFNNSFLQNQYNEIELNGYVNLNYLGKKE